MNPKKQTLEPAPIADQIREYQAALDEAIQAEQTATSTYGGGQPQARLARWNAARVNRALRYAESAANRGETERSTSAAEQFAAPAPDNP